VTGFKTKEIFKKNLKNNKINKMRNKNKNIVTAKKFYKTILEQKEHNKFKLINGLFIVKYINKDICFYVGDF